MIWLQRCGYGMGWLGTASNNISEYNGWNYLSKEDVEKIVFSKAGPLKQIENTSKGTACKRLYIVHLCVLLQRLWKIVIVIAIFLQRAYRHKVIHLPI